MKKTSFRVSKELKDQILKRIKEDGISVAQAAEDHGIATKTIYSWLTKGVTKSVSWSEHNKLKKENQELKTFIGELTVELSKAKKKS
jgi:transposase-like protein